MTKRWTIDVCNACDTPHQNRQSSSCIIEFDPAGDELAGTYKVEVVPVIDFDEPITVTLKRREWMTIRDAARDYDVRIPREQGDGGACLDEIERALND